MTESEFNTLADAVFERIERTLDESGANLDYDSNGNVLTIEFTNGGKLIVNRHTPNREIWLAAQSGGFHFSWQGDRWINTRDGGELFAELSRLTQLGCGQSVAF
ncbi:MAG: iron donor protein CyaY [Sideroxydans sp.]